MVKRNPFVLIIAVLMAVVAASLIIFPSLALSYWFEPNSTYTQSSSRATLHISLSPSDPAPVRVDWINPAGTHITCSGGQGVCWDQSVAANGTLNWRAFYFPIAGFSRLSGTYTAVTYSVSSEIFRTTFTISGGSTTTTPEPTPVPTPTPIPLFQPDTTFDTDGIVTTDFGTGYGGYTYEHGQAVAIQVDGKIVMAGYYSAGGIHADYDFAVARYNSDGSLDTGFGSGGKVTTDFGTDADMGNAIALQEGGKIVVAGYLKDTSSDFALARYNSNGSLDTGFGTDGKVITDFGQDDKGYAVATQSGGKILAAGYTCGSTWCAFALARYNNDGSLDTSFGTGGKVTTDFNGTGIGQAVLLQAGDKIVMAGYSSGTTTDFALARFNSDGSLDGTFGSGGKVTTDFDGHYEFGYAAALQSDGKIVVAGQSSDGYVFALVRYNVDGSLDVNFGMAGIALAGFADSSKGYAVAIQADGKIVVAGTRNSSGATDFAVARFNSNGSLDTGSGTSGKVTTDLGFGGPDQGQAVAIQADGKIVMAGTYDGATSYDFALVRYNLNKECMVYLPAIIR
jgi:uncharacterized delta-60 repeat protein